MKIREKLLSIPAIVLFLMILMGVLGTISMENMRTGLRDIYEIRFQSQRISAEALNETTLANIGVYRLFTWQNNYDDQKIKAATNEIDEHIDKATHKIDDLKNNTAISNEAKDQLHLITQKLESYKKQSASAIEMSQVDPNMGLTSMQSADETFKDVQNLIQNLVTETETNAQHDYQNSVATSKNSIYAFVALLLLAIAIGITFSLWLGGKLIKSVKESIVIAKRIADGNLTGNIHIDSDDEIGELQNALNDMKNNLHAMVSNIIESSNQMEKMTQNISEHSGIISQGTSEQNLAAVSIASAIEQMSHSISSINTSAKDANEFMQSSTYLTNKGKMALESVRESMQRIEHSAHDNSKIVQSLGNESEQISNIISVIRGIADQTNLLALNAAIEAARAGEQGRGFAVVADEVRSLAARTASSTQEISAMIGSIQDRIADAVSGMESSVNFVGEGGNLANNAEDAVALTAQKINEVAQMVSEISAALQEQRHASEIIANQIHQVAQIAEHNNQASTETTTSIEELSSLSKKLHVLVSSFKI